jgi:hypothetical protein
VFGSLRDIPQQAQDSALGICENDVAAGIKLEEESVLAVGEGDFDDTVGADLADGCDSPGAEELAQSSDERGGSGGGCSGKRSEVGAETGVDDELLAVLWFCELEEEDARREVVDICETKRDELGGELVSDDLARVSTCTCEWWGSSGGWLDVP